MTPSKVHCDHCGANLTPAQIHTGQCAYCGTALPTNTSVTLASNRTEPLSPDERVLLEAMSSGTLANATAQATAQQVATATRNHRLILVLFLVHAVALLAYVAITATQEQSRPFTLSAATAGATFTLLLFIWWLHRRHVMANSHHERPMQHLTESSLLFGMTNCTAIAAGCLVYWSSADDAGALTLGALAIGADLFLLWFVNANRKGKVQVVTSHADH